MCCFSFNAESRNRRCFAAISINQQAFYGLIAQATPVRSLLAGRVASELSRAQGPARTMADRAPPTPVALGAVSRRARPAGGHQRTRTQSLGVEFVHGSTVGALWPGRDRKKGR